MEKIVLKVTEEFDNTRIDKYISDNSELSRNQVQIFIEKKLITVNNKAIKSSYKVKNEDEVIIELHEPEPVNIEPQNLNLEIVYEDNDVAVVYKPRGMVVHPSIGHYSDTLVNGLMYQLKNLSGINSELRPGIVHRIDKDTDGLLMVAKNDIAHEDLVNQLVNRSVNRKYIALVHGTLDHDQGRIEAPIARSKNNRKLMDVVDGGKEAITNFKVLKRYENHTLIECKLETGRTHQIRVHMKYINHPLVGDLQYGRRKEKLKQGQMLNANTIGFIHPKTKEYIQFSKDIDSYFKNYLDTLE